MILLFRELKSLYLIGVLSFFAFACSDSDDSPVETGTSERGDILEFSQTTTLTASFLYNLLSTYGIEDTFDIDLLYDVDIYKMTYATIGPNSESQDASGSIFVPKGQNNLPLISLQHGTQANRDRVGSANPFYSPEGLLAASIGYFAVVPDYLGLGSSEILHPYLNETASASVVVDAIRAARQFADQNEINLNGQVFLAGYSEGGYVTLAAQKDIELNHSSEIAVTASTPMAGPYDINLTARSIIEQQVYEEPSFLAFLIVAYDEYYEWNRIDDIFNSPYNQNVVELFNGSLSTEDINPSLSNDVTVLFSSEFINNYLDGNDTQVISAFTENSLLDDWSTQVPTRFYHGGADEFVPFENAETARDIFIANGSTNVEIISIPGGTHSTSVFPSILGAVAWFEGFSQSTLALK
ncbi:MAG: alpha/beta fold hydrolase [Ignavibacteria bacterium]